MEGPVWAAACLGLRRGEVCGLKVTDVDMEAGILSLKATRDKWGEYPIKGATEGEERAIALPEVLLQKLLGYSEDGQLYVFLDRGRPIHPDRITKSMAELCRAAEVPAMTFHDLRAAAASNLRALGVDPWTIMTILGHSSLDMTTIYQDVRSKDQQAAIGALASALVVGGE